VKIAYLDCSMGISGDMTLAALIDAGVNADVIRTGIRSLNLPGVRLLAEEVMRGGFRAVHVKVEHPEQHAHRHLGDIEKIIDQAEKITDKQKALAKEIFLAVALAEAKVHGSTLQKVHFHEVGAIDSIVDIVGAAIGFDLLGADRIVCSRIPTGQGQVQIDHGICTVPTPGTAEILKGIPLVDVPVEAELTTPTGAAIVKTLVDQFSHLPGMTIEQIGYGAGTRTFSNRANLLRIFVGEAIEATERDQVCLLETNLDDVTGEVIGYAKQNLLASGALDVYTTAIQMKKDRPGVQVSVICKPAESDKLESILFEQTGTLGIRRQLLDRSILSRDEHSVQTIWGTIAGKLGWQANGKTVFSPEFEACARVADEQNIPLREVYRAAVSVFAATETLTQPQKQPQSPHHRHDHDHDHDHGHSHDHDHG